MKTLFVVVLLLPPFIVSAFPTDFKAFVLLIISLLQLFVVIILSIAIVAYLINGAWLMLNASNESNRADGKRKLIWGIIGIFVMVSVWGIVRLLVTTFGF